MDSLDTSNDFVLGTVAPASTGSPAVSNTATPYSNFSNLLTGAGSIATGVLATLNQTNVTNKAAQAQIAASKAQAASSSNMTKILIWGGAALVVVVLLFAFLRRK
jgi:uncharacterized membrane protein YjfL (UPF0719 family)